MRSLQTNTIGEMWVKSCKLINRAGQKINDENKELRELMHFVGIIKKPSMSDRIIEKYGDKEMISWMLSNFLEQKKVPELKNTLSYGTRIFNYNGKNQFLWVVDKLRKKPETKAATITMLMPDSDDGYIPCVSMLDFKIRDKKLVLTAICRAIDFGKKVYANMLAIHKIQCMIAEELGIPTGELVFEVISAHIYQEDFSQINTILEATERSIKCKAK